MLEILTSPLFYLFITVGIYTLFAFLKYKFKSPLLNPLLWTIVFIVGYILLIVFLIHGNVEQSSITKEVDKYQDSTMIFDILLAPVTVALAVPLYLNRHVLKENWLPILIATFVGTLTSIGSVVGLSFLLGLNRDVMYALFPRGVTTAIAKEIGAIMGVSEYVAITVTVVVLTGVVGAVLGPLLIKIFGKKDDIAIGLALGSSSHAIGTSKAFDYSEKAGAIATVSIITNGLLTVLVAVIVSLIH